MKTIKIIDLLNKIANGEEVPKTIEYNDEIRDYCDEDKDYICRDSQDYYLFYNVLISGNGAKFKDALNDEVEIIEEKKLPERIQLDDWIEFTTSEDINNIGDMFNKNSRTFVEKINKIIDYLESKEEVINYKDSSIK